MTFFVIYCKARTVTETVVTQRVGLNELSSRDPDERAFVFET